MNSKRFAIVAAAAMAIGGVSIAYAEDKPAADPNNQGTLDKAGQAVREGAASVGIGSADKQSAKMSPHAAGIHNVLGKVAEKAFSKDGVDDVAGQFAKADRDRLDQNKDALKSDDTLNGRIAEIQKDWKAKYGKDFNIVDQDKVFNVSFASIDEMKAGDAARTASGTVSGDAGATPTAAPADATAKATDAARDTAVVHIAASHGLPALDVPMVHETFGWAIDIPDTVDSAKLKSNLQTALTDLDEKKDQWPADIDDGYRAATHRLLLAIFDVPATETGAGAGGAAPATPVAPATPAPGANQ